MIVFYYPQNAPPGLGRLPMSVLALAAMAEGKYDYTVVDGNTDPGALTTIRGMLRTRPTMKVVALSVMPGTQLMNAIRDSKAIKEEFPDVTIVWGGYFPSMHTESVLNSAYVDYVIRGQGERAFPELLDVLLNGGGQREVHNLSYRANGSFVHNPEHPTFDPNARPLFPYDRMEMNKYALPTFVGDRTFCHESSVGCPHKCNFCGVVDVFHSRWKAETVDRTMETLELLSGKYRMDGMEFHDSDFFVSEGRVAELSERMTGLNIRWWGEGRIDTLLRYSDKTWKMMERSGCKMIFFGAESGLNETLTLMDKGGVTIEQTKALAKRCAQYNIISEFSFVMGANPERTEEDIEATIDLMYELQEINPLSRMHPFVYTPVPFGSIYDSAVQGGLQYPKNLDEWLSHEWKQYSLRQNPHTPWLTRRLHKRIINFRAVQQSYMPKLNDRRIPQWKVSLLRWASAWRYKNRFFAGAYEIRTLLRLLMRQPSGAGGF